MTKKLKLQSSEEFVCQVLNQLNTAEKKINKLIKKRMKDKKSHKKIHEVIYNIQQNKSETGRKLYAVINSSKL